MSEFDLKRALEDLNNAPSNALIEAGRALVAKEAEILWLRKENRKLREAVIRERAVQSMMRRECVHAYEGVTPSKGCKDNAEKELRAEGVIE